MEENTKEKIAKKTRRTVQYASLTNVLQLRRPSMEKMGVTERSMTHSPFLPDISVISVPLIIQNLHFV